MKLQPLLLALLPLFLWSLFFAGCKRSSSASSEIAYVSAPQASLRDRVSAVYNKVGTLNNGDRVTVIAHDRRTFVKVRSDSGLEGYVEVRYLAPAAVFDQFQDLARTESALPAQARAVVRNDVNMHLTPARDSEKLFQLKENDKVELLRRAVTPKNAVTKVAPAPKPKLATTADKKAPPPEPVTAAPATPSAPDPGPLEDWWLVRDTRHRVGWVLGRMLDVDLPLEVAQYAEGKRVVAAYVLTTVEDPESDKPNHQVPYYLMLTNEPHDGQPQDFNAIRVFTWNTRKHRYETAYRERDLNGYLPVTVGKEDFGKEGVLPTFTIRGKDDTGAPRERKYRLEGVLVKRVYAPGEQPQPKLQRTAAKKPVKAAHSHHRKRR